MSASLVGSEMCIRDRNTTPTCPCQRGRLRRASTRASGSAASPMARRGGCLLYTSDAADDM
eukprot:7327483-Alexandrium_andersonii.AAC.1